MFLPPGRSTPVLPPIAASTWASRVVGICTNSMPRRKQPAANPARSPTLPPPKARTRLSRLPPAASISFHSRPAELDRLRPLPLLHLQDHPPGGGPAEHVEPVAMERLHARGGDEERGAPGEPVLQLRQDGRDRALPDDHRRGAVRVMEAQWSDVRQEFSPGRNRTGSSPDRRRSGSSAAGPGSR